MQRDRYAKLVVLFFVYALLFNYPLVDIAGGHRLLLGLPVLYVYFLGTWISLIGFIWWITTGPRMRWFRHDKRNLP